MKVNARTKILSLDMGLILFLGLLSLTWFRGNFIIATGDFGFPLSRIQFFHNTLYFWDHTISLGYPAPGQLAFLMPYTLYAALTEHIGLSLLFFEKSLFYLWFALSGLAMYYLCSILGFKRIAKLAASFFYMMNPYVLQIPWHLASGMLMPAYVISPLILGLFIKSLNSAKGLKYIFILAIVWFVMGTYGYANPALAIVHWFIIFSYLLYYCLINNKERRLIKQAVYLTSILIILWLSLNLFWIIPYGSIIFEEQRAVSDPSLGFISNLETFKLNSGKLLGALRLGGLWSLHGEWEGVPYYRWAKFYLTRPFILISFLIPFFSFLPLLKRSEYKRTGCIYFSILAIVGLFLVKGAKPPLANVNIWFYQHIPLLGTAFKANIQKWGLMLTLALTPLLGLGISSTVDFLSKRFSRSLSFLSAACIFMLLFLVLVFPFWTGDVIFAGGGIIPSARIKIPEYYYRFKEWTGQGKDSERIFSLPLSKSYNTIYLWEDTGYSGGDIIRFFSAKPVIYTNTGRGYEIPLLLSKQIEEKPTQVRAKRLFGLLNVKYILLHRDINWALIKHHPWWFRHNLGNLTAFLNSQEGIKRDRNFGKLNLYKLDDEYFLPRIYSATSPVFIKGDVKTLVPLTYTRYLDNKPVLFFSEQQEEKVLEKLLFQSKAFTFSNSNPLDLTLQILEPDYGIKIEDSKKPVVFEAKEEGVYQVYTKNEKVKIEIKSLEQGAESRERILQAPNSKFQASGNQWRKIGEIELKRGKYKIRVEEAPQELVIVPEEKVIQGEDEIRDYLKKAEDSPTHLFSKELSSDIDSWEERSLKGSFYLPSSGKYSLRAKVSPQYVKAPDYGLKERIGKGWSFVPRNVKYFASTGKDILTVSTYFDGDAREREFLGLKRNIEPIDLEKYPSFEINYRLTNSGVQKIEIILGIDLDNDGKTDTRISEELPATLKKQFSRHSFNLYEKVRNSLSQSLSANTSFHLVKIYLKISKREGLDCSTFSDKGWYKTSFKNFRLYGFSEDKCVKSRNYAFNERICLIKKLKRRKSRIILSRSFENLDLEKYPYINLIHQNEDPRNLLVSMTLHLDFDADGKSDGKVTQEGIPTENIPLEALQLAKIEFPNRDHYYLVKLDIGLSKNSELDIEERELTRIATAKTQKETERRQEKQGRESVFLQHLQIYNEEILPYKKARPLPPILKVDQKKVLLIKSGYWYIASPIYLEEGYHNLEALFPGLESKLDFMAIGGREWSRIERGRESTQIKGTESKDGPEISFQKINPTKYRVKVKNATEPFWLVFSESYHEGWRAYVKKSKIKNQKSKIKEENFDEIIAEYPGLGVKEAKHLQKFTPGDIRYLFRKADIKEHYLVNGYANGWWVPIEQFKIKNEKLKIKDIENKPEEFEIILYFWPQSLFYLGLFISGATFVGCIGYLVGTGVRRRKRKTKSR